MSVNVRRSFVANFAIWSSLIPQSQNNAAPAFNRYSPLVSSNLFKTVLISVSSKLILPASFAFFKYVLNAEERDSYLAGLSPNTKYEITRMKGLGEMDADELNETTMDINTRVLRQITVDDAIAADEVFSKLMGEEVEPRREFIETNATYVENLDI